MKQTLIRTSRIFLEVMFLFSGISKLLSMAFFDAMVAELFLGPNYYDFPTGLDYTQRLSRVLIASELVLGAAILMDKWVKRITIPAIFGMLLLFTVHLFYEGLTSDKGFVEGNCGCFGDVLPMNNLESIIKNVVAMLAAVFVWLKYKEEEKLAVWAGPLVIGIVTLLTLLMGVKTYQEVEEQPENPEVIVEDSLLTTVPEPTTIEISEQPDSATKISVVKDDPTAKVKKDEPELSPILTMLQKMGTMSDGKPMEISKGEVAV